MRRLMSLVIVAILPHVAHADTDRMRIETRDAFVALVKDRPLTRFGVTLNVLPDGRISGRAFGQPVRGDWTWKSGFFCRDLFFGEQALGPNCQVVERRGEGLRFIADQGQGDHADLRLR